MPKMCKICGRPKDSHVKVGPWGRTCGLIPVRTDENGNIVEANPYSQRTEKNDVRFVRPDQLPAHLR